MENYVDKISGKEVRKTDNGLRECDIEAPQDNKPLTIEQIDDILKNAGGEHGDA